MLVPLAGVIVTDLSRQNLTVSGDDPNPVPPIVNEPPALSEIVVAESDVIDGALTRSTVTVFSPLSAIFGPEPCRGGLSKYELNKEN